MAIGGWQLAGGRREEEEEEEEEEDTTLTPHVNVGNKMANQ